MNNTIENPLILTFYQRETAYKVNKPLNQSGSYVDLSIAKQLADQRAELLEALQMWVDYHDSDMSEVEAEILSKTKAAITKATNK